MKHTNDVVLELHGVVVRFRGDRVGYPLRAGNARISRHAAERVEVFEGDRVGHGFVGFSRWRIVHGSNSLGARRHPETGCAQKGCDCELHEVSPIEM